MGSNAIALGVNPPAQPQGPLQMAQGALSVQDMINQGALQKQAQQSNAITQQEQQIQLKQAQQQQQDTEGFNQAFKDAGGDWNKTIDNATKSGVSGTYITQRQIARADQVTKLATADKDTLSNIQTRGDALAKDAVELKGISDPQERATRQQQMVNAHLTGGAGYKPTDFPSHTMTDDELDETIAHNSAAQALIKEAQENQAKAAALPGAKAESTAKELSTAAQMFNGIPPNQLAWTSRRAAAAKLVSPDTLALIPEEYSPQNAESVRQLGIAPKDLANQSPDKLELQSFLKNPPKGYQATPVDFLRYQKSLTPLLNFNLANQTGAPGAPVATIAKQFGMSPEAFDQAAEKYNATGVLPAVGRGPNGIALQRALMNRSGDLHPGAVLAANSAEYKANQGSLNKLQSNLDNVTAFENTALKNLDQIALTGSKIPDLSARFANVPVRMISSQMIGTPEMAQFKTALLTGQTEAAKVLSSANATGVLSDSARHEAQEVLDGNLPYPAMLASINQLKTDFANRHQSYAEQVGDIQQRLGAKAPQAQKQFTAPVGAPTAPKEDGHKLKANGQVVAVSKGGQWAAP